jgi:hypothetical protein
MTDSSEAKIERWRQLIAECRDQAASMSPAGRHALQTIITSYEHLIDAKPASSRASVFFCVRKRMLR